MTIYILPTKSNKAHVVIETAKSVRRFLFASAASVARIARFALNNGMTAKTTNDGTVYEEPDWDKLAELSDPINDPMNCKFY